MFPNELGEIPVKPSCGRNFGKPIDFVVNADGVPRSPAEPHYRDYRTDGAGGAVRAVTKAGTREQGPGNRRPVDSVWRTPD